MMTVFKRELRSLFHSIFSYLFLGVMLAATGLLVTFNHLSKLSPALYAAYNILLLTASLLLPLLTCTLFSNERKQGTHVLLFALPLRQSDVVLGKLLALLALVGLSALGSAVYPLLFSAFGAVDYLACYNGLIGFLAVCLVFLSFDVLMAVRFSRPYVCLVASYGLAVGVFATDLLSMLLPATATVSLVGLLIMALLIGAGILLATRRPSLGITVGALIAAVALIWFFAHRESLAGVLTLLLSTVSLFRRMEPFTLGLFDGELIILALSASAFFLYMAVRTLRTRRDAMLGYTPHRIPSLGHRVLPLCLAFLIVLLNLCTLLLPITALQRDVTEGERFTPSASTVAYLDTLEEDVSIYLLDGDGTEKKFEAYMERYASYSDRLRIANVSSETLRELLGSGNISPYSLLIIGPYRYQLIRFDDMFRYAGGSYGDFSVTEYRYYVQYMYQALTQGQNVKDTLTALLNDYALHFVGEAKITEAIEYVSLPEVPRAYALQGHGEDSVTEGNLGTLLTNMGYACTELSLPDAAAVPSDAGVIVINAPKTDYTEAEANMILSYLKDGGHALIMTNPANALMPNLSSILAYYGSAALSDPITLPDSETPNSFTAEINPDHDFTNIFSTNEGMVLTDASAIEYDSSLRGPLLITPLLTTPENALLGETAGMHAVAVCIEEPVGSKTAKIIWVTGADTFNAEDTKLSDAVMAFPTYGLIWLSESYESEVGEIDSKPYSEPSLTVKQSAAVWLGILTIGVLPVGVIGAGVLYLYKRKKR